MGTHDNLEEFQNPENYDLEEAQYVARPLAFYLSLAEEFGGLILDIACGTGLYALPMAERGFEVTGIDLANLALDNVPSFCKDSRIDQHNPNRLQIHSIPRFKPVLKRKWFQGLKTI